MIRKGDLIFWEISGFTIDKPTLETALEGLGIGRLTPRNDFKTATLKAIRTVTKGNDKLYRTFNNTLDRVSFGVFTEVPTDDDLSLKREVIVTLNKDTGILTAVNIGDEAMWTQLQAEYDKTKKTIDGNQFRSIVLKVLKEECFGIPMRKNGAVYFIDKRFDSFREKLSSLFRVFPESMVLHSVPIFENAGTDEALESAINESVFADIENLIKDVETKFHDGTITKRLLEGRQTEANEILEKIKVHEKNLRSKAAEVTTKLSRVTGALNAVVDRVAAGIFDPEDFYKELERFERSRS